MTKVSVFVCGAEENGTPYIIENYEELGPQDLIEIETKLLNELRFVHGVMAKKDM